MENNGVYRQFERKGSGISDLLDRRGKEARGEIQAIHLKQWPRLNELIGGGLRRGEVSVVAGPGGNGKTNFALNIIISMASKHRQALYMPLEDDEWEIMSRVCSILYCNWDIMREPKNVEEFERFQNMLLNSDEKSLLLQLIDSLYIMKNPKQAVEAGGEIFAPDLRPSDLLEWLNGDMCKNKELIIIDPISMVNFGAEGKFWEAQEKFVQNCHAIAKHRKFHLMMLAHIRKRQTYKGQQQDLSVDDIQGSAAFNRHTRYALLLDYHPNGRESNIVNRYTEQVINHKHTMYLAKANYGSGTGKRLAFSYETSGPQFRENGIIEK